MEVRGSMTQFEPLTPERVLEETKGMITYAEFSKILSEYGMSIEYVVYDATRHFQNTFYADYDNALYRTLYLNYDYIKSAGCVDLENFSEIIKSGNAAFKTRNWNSLYSFEIPVPMLIYDFQRRFRDIKPENVFDIWHKIYKRIDYAGGVWNSDILEYVFSHAPKPKIPSFNENGMVTIYRGMGELSQPPETAISWSTHPGNALWFANHCGRGTHLVIAEVSLDNIVAYFGGFSHENEIIVRPNTVCNIRNEDMYPAKEETFVKLTVPALINFKIFGRQAAKLGYKEETTKFAVHGIKHILRVLLLSLIYFYNSGTELTKEDRNILVYFSLLHDIGRTNEDEDENHGLASIQLIKSKGLRIAGIKLSPKAYRMANFIIQYHCREDSEGMKAIQELSEFSRKDKERTEQLYCICKDMDGLDRVRFNGLDYRMLRTEFAKKLPLIAGCLLEEDIIAAINKQD